MRPEYSGGSLVNLIASIVAARGGEPLHAPLADLPVSELREATTISCAAVRAASSHAGDARR
jgi:hypothetical protein